MGKIPKPSVQTPKKLANSKSQPADPLFFGIWLFGVWDFQEDALE
jgi:hypothetical protein